MVAAVLVLVGLLAVNRDMAYLRSVPAADVPNFQCYALGFWQGAARVARPQAAACRRVWQGTPRRFHALPREYPPLALAIFTVPLLTPWVPYADAYVWWMALLVLVTTALLAWRRSAQAALAFLIYTLLAGWTLALERYDLVPALCVLLALVAARRDRSRLATVLLAVGTLLKWFPLAFFPLLLIQEWRARRAVPWDLVGIMAAVVGAGLLLTLAIDPAALWSPLVFQAVRPPQIESTPATLLWLTGALSGLPVHPVVSYNSLNLLGPTQSLWSAVCTLAWVAWVALACRRLWQGRDSLDRGFILVLLGTLATAKVFSTQYLLWVLPAAAFVEGLRLRWVFLCGLTLLIAYTYTLGAVTPLMLDAILVRNAVLVVLGLLYLWGPGDRAGRGQGSRAPRRARACVGADQRISMASPKL